MHEPTGAPISQCWKWIAVAAGTLILSVLHGLRLGHLPEDEVVFDFRTEEVDRAAFARWTGWRPSRQGLVAPAGEPAELVLHLTNFRFQDVLIEMTPTREGAGQIEATLLLPPDAVPSPENVPKKSSGESPWSLNFGRLWERIPATALVQNGQPVNLTRLRPGGGSCLFFVSARPGSSGPLLERITLRYPTVSFWLFLPPVFFPVFLLTLWHFAEAFPRYPPLAVLGIGSAALAALLGILPLEMLDYMPLMACSCALFACLPGLLQRGRPVRLIPVAVALLAFLGASLRWDSLNSMRFKAPEPDAAGFRIIARQMTWFYDTEHREPLFIFFIKIALKTLGDSDLSLRVLSSIFSVALIVLLYRVGQELFGDIPGLIAAALLASNRYWAWHSGRGLRLELFTLTLLFLTWAVFTPRPPAPARHALWLGLASACVCLVRITSTWFCLLGIAYALRRRGGTIRSLILSTCVALLPLIPFVVQCAVRYGDPLQAINLHIKYYRNMEFKDQPGYPSSEELASNAYAGPDVTSLEYFFQMHSPWELADRTGSTLLEIFLGKHARDETFGRSPLLYWWAIPAYLMLACSPRRIVLVWMLLLIGPTVWLFGPRSQPEWRLIDHVGPFIYLAMGHAAAEVLSRFHAPSERAELGGSAASEFPSS
ncbi:MAG: glycosyltransferase family 39 protein [Planctomycetes bacterium]|nr:glycosyltransferase family 39 protein [Planctomycetota bacterium]